MRYDFIDVANENVMKNRFAMLLIEFDCCRVDDNCDENEKVKKSYLIVNRDKRDDFDDVIDRETISAQNIDFFDVACDVIDVKDKINEINEVNNAVVTKMIENFFACFVRTCSCNLMLLKNLTEQRLHENVSVFFLLCDFLHFFDV